MCKSYENKCMLSDSTTEKTFKFIKHKIKGLLPNVYIAWIIAFLVNHIYASPAKTIRDFVFAVPELTFISQIGISNGLQNEQCWYLSAMLITLAIIYPLLCKIGLRKFTRIVSPILLLVCLAFIQQRFGVLEVHDEVVIFFNIGIIRAMAEICIGSWIFYLSRTINATIELTDFSKRCIKVLEVLMYIFIIALSFFNIGGATGFVTLFLISIACLITVTSSQLSQQHRNHIFIKICSFSR